MARSWTFGKKLTVVFSLLVVIVLAVGAVSYWSTSLLVDATRGSAHSSRLLKDCSDFLRAARENESAERGFALTGNDRFVTLFEQGTHKLEQRYADIVQALGEEDEMRKRRFVEGAESAQRLLDERMAELKNGFELRRKGGVEAAAKLTDADAPDESGGTIGALWKKVKEVQAEEEALLKGRDDAARASGTAAKAAAVGGTGFALLFASVVGFILIRSLNRQIGAAVQQVSSSSAELQANAAQQATSSKEQATATTEVATTTKELLATTRQIADSAQRVAKIAEDTAGAAQTGDRAVQGAQEAIGRIRRQVDLVVTHMLDLGKKSQQIGGILEIINELSEQTNILAINATIESAGAGEAGKRFAVVADEVRKLADRVGGSAKEIRTLVDEIRAASNTTVMATEDGSKAVDAGTRQFGQVAASFKQIADLVGTTTEASREIEISARQQTTAVEQVNLAIADVATVAKDTESSSRETLEASAQLVRLSKELTLLVESNGRM